MSRPIKKAITLTKDELAEVLSILKGRVQTHTSFRNATILKLVRCFKSFEPPLEIV